MAHHGEGVRKGPFPVSIYCNTMNSMVFLRLAILTIRNAEVNFGWENNICPAAEAPAIVQAFL